MYPAASKALRRDTSRKAVLHHANVTWALARSETQSTCHAAKSAAWQAQRPWPDQTCLQPRCPKQVSVNTAGRAPRCCSVLNLPRNSLTYLHITRLLQTLVGMLSCQYM